MHYAWSNLWTSTHRLSTITVEAATMKWTARQSPWCRRKWMTVNNNNNLYYNSPYFCLSVLLIWGLYRPSSEPIALRNVLKCPTRHTLQTIRFWHFSSAALIVKKLKNAVLRHRSVNEFCEFWVLRVLSSAVSELMSSANEFCRPSSEPIALRNVLKCPTRHTLHNIIRFWHFSSLLSLQKTPKTQFYATVLRTVSPLFYRCRNEQFYSEIQW